MSIIAEFTLPAEAFALQQTFESSPPVRIEIERLATHSRDWVMPFLWATSDDIEAIEHALRDDPSIEELTVMGSTDRIREFNVIWSDRIQEQIDEIINKQGIMQEAEAVGGTWHLKLKFVDQQALRDFQAYFQERESSFELQRLYQASDPTERAFGLTPEQRDALVVALNSGYFSVPRDTQSQELAEQLDISTNALSQRLRRATGNLAKHTLLTSPPDDTADTGHPRSH